jgi:flagellar motor switch protein FliG
MTDSANALPAPLSGPRKAAMFLMGVGDQVGMEVLRHLAPEEVRLITTEIAATKTVGSEQMLFVFREFETLTTEGRLFAKGGVECARRLVEQAFGPESAQKLLAAVPNSESTVASVAASAGLLESTDPQQLSMFLKNEHPQTIAVVLSNLPAEVAGGLMKSFSEETQAQVALRMASLDRVSPEVFQKITEAIGSKLRSIRQISKTDGVRALAALLNHVDAGQSEAILAKVDEQNQPVADSVRSLMFVFEDILNIDKEGMRALVGKLDRKVLTLALKGTDAKMREHFTQCMSQRSAEMLIEDMEALGPVRIRDVEGAQKEVIVALRQLQQEGTVSINREGGDEYVV